MFKFNFLLISQEATAFATFCIFWKIKFTPWANCCFSKLLTRNHRNCVDNSNILKWNLIFIKCVCNFFSIKSCFQQKSLSYLPSFLHVQHLRMFYILLNFYRSCEFFVAFIKVFFLLFEQAMVLCGLVSKPMFCCILLHFTP